MAAGRELVCDLRRGGGKMKITLSPHNKTCTPILAVFLMVTIFSMDFPSQNLATQLRNQMRELRK